MFDLLTLADVLQSAVSVAHCGVPMGSVEWETKYKL